MEEQFIKIVEDYEISNLGNLRKLLKNGDYKIINCSVNNKGYKYFQLQRNKKRINYSVHCLVSKAFLGERPEKLVIDHKDRNKLNNNINNLHYITQKENCINTDRYLEHIEEQEPKKRAIMRAKEYVKNNREKVLQKKKDYYKNNIENIKAYLQEHKEQTRINKKKSYLKHKVKYSNAKKEPVLCECGKTIKKGNLSEHKRSKIHLKLTRED